MPAAQAALVCLMPMYGIVLLMLVVDPPSWVTGVVYLTLAGLATVPWLGRWRELWDTGRGPRAVWVTFGILCAVIVLSWLRASRGDPMADRAMMIAPMLMIAPLLGAALARSMAERRALLWWIVLFAALTALILGYWVGFGLLSDKPRLQFGIGVRVYHESNHWSGQRVYVDPIGVGWLCGMGLTVAGVYLDRLVHHSLPDRQARLVRALLGLLVLGFAWMMLRATGRSPLLSFAVAGVVYVAIVCAWSWRRRLAMLGAAAVLGAALFATLPAATQAYYLGTTATYDYERKLDLTHNRPGMTSGDYAARNVVRRKIVWAEHARIFLDHPIVGVGHSGAHRHADEAVDRLSHNLVLEMAAGSGLIGLGALFAFLAAVTRLAWTHVRDPTLPERERTLATIAALIVVASLVQLNFSGTITGMAPLYAGIGYLLASARSHERQLAQEAARRGAT